MKTIMESWIFFSELGDLKNSYSKKVVVMEIKCSPSKIPLKFSFEGAMLYILMPTQVLCRPIERLYTLHALDCIFKTKCMRLSFRIVHFSMMEF